MISKHYQSLLINYLIKATLDWYESPTIGSIKSDGLPLYHLTIAVFDECYQVIRSEVNNVDKRLQQQEFIEQQ